MLQTSQSKFSQNQPKVWLLYFPHNKCKEQIHVHRDAAAFKRGMKQSEDEERDHEASEGGQIARDS